jgi:uncharacterized protein (DUF427 family)
MTDRTIMIPGPDHPITIERNPLRVVVTLAGETLADSVDVLTLKEAKYPLIEYVPRADVDMTKLVRSEHTTYCPFKGECSYYSLVGGDERSLNAVWTYEVPYAAVAAIKDHLAFYPDRVGITQRARS